MLHKIFIQKLAHSLSMFLFLPVLFPGLDLGAQAGATANGSYSVSQEETELRTSLRADPANPALMRSLVAVLESSGRLRGAIVLRRSILAGAEGPEAIGQARLELAIALVESEQSGEAIPLLQTVLAADPSNEPATFELGTAYARLKDFPRASEAFTRATQLKPGDAAAQLSVAKALVTLLRYSDAESYLEAAAHAGADSAEMHFLRGTIYSHTSRSLQAVSEFEKAVQMDPANGDALLPLGECLIRVGRAREAIVPLTEAAKRQPSVADYFQLAKAYRALGDTSREQEAVASLKELQQNQIVDTKMEALKSQASHLMVEKKYAQAADVYQAALVLRPLDSEMLYQLALVRGKLHEPEIERRLLRQVLAQSPQHVGALTQLGILEGLNNETDAAKDHLGQALRLDPQRADALSNLAILIAREGQIAAARAMLASAVESDPAYGVAYRNLGLLDGSVGRSVEAESELRKSLSIDPEDAISELALAQLYLGDHRTADAVAALYRATSLAPNNTAAHLLLAQTLYTEGEVNGALEETRRILLLAPGLPEAADLQIQLCNDKRLTQTAKQSCSRTE